MNKHVWSVCIKGDDGEYRVIYDTKGKPLIYRSRAEARQEAAKGGKGGKGLISVRKAFISVT